MISHDAKKSIPTSAVITKHPMNSSTKNSPVKHHVATTRQWTQPVVSLFTCIYLLRIICRSIRSVLSICILDPVQDPCATVVLISTTSILTKYFTCYSPRLILQMHLFQQQHHHPPGARTRPIRLLLIQRRPPRPRLRRYHPGQESEQLPSTELQ